MRKRTDDLDNYSARAIRCKGWRWLPGMTWTQAETPDLTDPATLGCLLALVRAAWQDPYLCVVGEPITGWRIDAAVPGVASLYGFDTEAEALVRALEAAP